MIVTEYVFMLDSRIKKTREWRVNMGQRRNTAGAAVRDQRDACLPTLITEMPIPHRCIRRIGIFQPFSALNHLGSSVPLAGMRPARW